MKEAEINRYKKEASEKVNKQKEKKTKNKDNENSLDISVSVVTLF